ncbi:MAG TPA: asparaginase [Mycobacteriales bacterium]|nr:asparaginase [Mycobacteriales bacterium]
MLLGSDGAIAASAGAPHAPVFPRSAVKPLQVVGLLRAGLDWDGGDLAVAAASHSGEPVHVARVRAALARAALTEDALGNTPDLPLDEPSAWAHLRAGGERDRVHQNCSGKHAAMLATCVTRGWRTDGYLDPDHPVQRAVRAGVEDLAGERAAHVGVDGCGAPLFAISLVALARAFARLVVSPPGTPGRRVADAMRAHPELVGGRDREVSRLMRGVPGLLAKDGAEAVFAAATPAGDAVALKIADGGSRGRVPVLVAALRTLGVDAPVLDELARRPVCGGGRVVGEIRARPVALT